MFCSINKTIAVAAAQFLVKATKKFIYQKFKPFFFLLKGLNFLLFI